MGNSEDIFLRETAWQFLLDQKINKLPVSSLSVAQSNGYRVLTYKEFAKIIDKPTSYLIDTYDNDGFVFWSKADQCYIICYNSDLPPTTCRWTVMHEIAHIVLGHVTPEAPPLTRVRKIEHPRFEREADGFVRRVLCPSIVLHDCKAFEVSDIIKLCGISKEAANYRSDYIKKLEIRNKWRTDPFEVEVEKQFRLFILSYWRNKSLYNCEFAEEFYIKIAVA